ncbi:hypothetical protein VT73_00870 [Rathayibacter toxicus]|uniref:Uncharacterized protein n=1 Tax=Rathayibacter toxicus TaxID=145458 RepID=A0A0U1PVN3_9MICO|nr:hypothetical protein VT73_00870 [Rathayibacter toxicus]
MAYVGGIQNCSNSLVTRVIRYDAVSATSNSWGNETSGTLGVILSRTISSAYGHEFSTSESKSDEIRMEAKPHTGAKIYIGKEKTRIRGHWEMHFGSRFYGHYYWYLHDTVEGQMKGQAWKIRTVAAQPHC